MAFSLAFLALLIERLVGYPQWLVARIGHPVMWIGALIDRLDRRFNNLSLSFDHRRRNGVIAFLILAGMTLTVSLIVERSLTWLPFGLFVVAIVSSSLIAQKSLEAHVKAVAIGLETGGLDGGREAVSMIVGRDPDQLDEAGVSREAGKLTRSSKRAAAQPKAP